MKANDVKRQGRRQFLFDYGTPIFGKPMTAAGVRQILGIRS